MLNAFSERVLTFIVRVNFRVHVLADVLETLLQLLVAFAFSFVKLGIFGVDDTTEALNNVFRLFLVGLS